MKSRLLSHVDNLDTYLYWFSVLMIAIGIMNNKLVPPKLDYVVFSGIFFFCMVLKPMIMTRSR